MKIMYVFHGISGAARIRDEEAIRAFPSALNQFVPGLACDVVPLDSNLVHETARAIRESSDLEYFRYMVSQMFSRNSGRVKLVICCTPDEALAQKARNAVQIGSWALHADPVVVIYNHDPDVVPWLIWHEMFHIFGAQDCYDATDPYGDNRTCGNEHRIMQYEPTVDNVGNRLFLCERNVQLMRDQLKSPSMSLTIRGTD